MIDWYVNDTYLDGSGGCDRCILGDRCMQEPISVVVCG